MRRLNLSTVQALAVASQLGFVLGAAVLLGILGGAFLDTRLGTSPLFLVVGSIVGAVAGIYSAAQLATYLLARFGKKNENPEQEQ